MLRKVAIIGPGLLGASLALGLRRADLAETVHVWARRPDAADEVMKNNVADRANTQLAPVVEHAEVVIFCTPMGAMAELARQALPHLHPETLVTDVASVKGPVEAFMAPLFKNHALWIGSHPMAGSEKAGLHAARPNLFAGATCLLTPTASTAPAAIARARAFWQDLGAHCFELDPDRHDQAVAQISHLPHLLAALLVRSVQTDALPFAGPGFRDTTRVAAGPAPMWTEILMENRHAVLQCLGTMSGQLDRAIHLLESRDEKGLHDLLAQANDVRQSLSFPDPRA